MARRKILGTFQMLWDCPSCGTKKLLGKDHRHCPNCGTVQDETRRYFPAHNEAVPTTYSPAADHECNYCGTPNAYNANNCVNCGASLSDAPVVRKRAPTNSMAAETVEAADPLVDARRQAQQKTRQAFHHPKAQQERERSREEDYERLRQEAEDIPLKPSTWSKDTKIRLGICGGMFGILGIIWMIFFWQKTIQVDVEARYWERSQIIEQFKSVSDEDWCSSKPYDAYNVSSSSRVHHHETVTDCYSCDCHDERYQSSETCHEVCSSSREPDGAGGYNLVETCYDSCDPVYDYRQVCEDRTHEEPVYEPYCHYTIDRWRSQRTAHESGGTSLEPVWPKLQYRQCEAVDLGCERPGAKAQKYIVYFRDLETREKHECEWTQEKWEGYEVGSKWQAVVKVLGGRFQCESLKRRGP